MTSITPRQVVLQDLRLAEGGNPRGFVMRCFAILVLGWLAIAALNVVVNPRGDFPTNYVRPLVVESDPSDGGADATFDAPGKGTLFAASGPNETVILGSSTAMLYRTAILEERGDGSTFNLAVPDMMPERMLVTYRAMQEQGRLPASLVVALDYYMLTWPSASAAGDTVSTGPRWSKSIGRAVLSTLSPGYLTDSLRSIWYALTDYPTIEPLAGEKGDYHHLGYIEAGLERSAFDRTTALNSYLEGRGELYDHPLQPDHLASVARLLELAREDGVEVVVVFQPVHPQLALGVADSIKLHNQVVAELRRSCHDGLVLLDYFDARASGWDLGHFYDAAHFDQEMSDQVLRRIAEGDEDLCGR